MWPFLAAQTGPSRSKWSLCLVVLGDVPKVRIEVRSKAGHGSGKPTLAALAEAISNISIHSQPVVVLAGPVLKPGAVPRGGQGCAGEFLTVL